MTQVSVCAPDASKKRRQRRLAFRSQGVAISHSPFSLSNSQGDARVWKERPKDAKRCKEKQGDRQLRKERAAVLQQMLRCLILARGHELHEKCETLTRSLRWPVPWLSIEGTKLDESGRTRVHIAIMFQGRSVGGNASGILKQELHCLPVLCASDQGNCGKVVPKST